MTTSMSPREKTMPAIIELSPKCSVESLITKVANCAPSAIKTPALIPSKKVCKVLNFAFTDATASIRDAICEGE